MRVAFIIENQLGHRALLANLKKALAEQTTVDPIWLPLEPYGDGLLDRIPRVRDQHGLTFGLKARRILREARSSGSFAACLMHTQRMAHLAVDRMRQVPTFLSIDATPIELDRFYRGALQGLPSKHDTVYGKIRDAVHRRTYAAARGIITMSESVSSSLASYGVNPADTLVLWPGVDVEQIRPPETPTCDEECRILFVGAEFERKGGNLLLRWVRETAHSDYRVDVVTKERIDPTPRVAVHSGFAPNEPGLIDLIRRADLLVLPTRADMSPWVIPEAKAAGTAVISTHVGAIPELVRDGVDGWLVNPDDYTSFAQRLDEALRDRKKLFEFGRRAREDAVERFNSVTNARKLVQYMVGRI